jgi:ABC-type transport system involved in multi-copper enzyme maturation permease subunit
MYVAAYLPGALGWWLMGVLRDIGLWLWRLLPANPILVRVVSAGGKRSRHMWARVIYLVVLFIVMLVMGGNMLGGSRSLADLAKQSTQTFMAVSLVQLFLMSFIAPVFTAGAITQEKDANTFHILLTTPLSNGQIVLGSLFSRLYFVWALLLAGLPIFCITMLFGGVTTREVFESFGLAAGTGLVTGSLAIMISVARIGTRRTIFSFFLGVAVYLLGIWAIGFNSWGQLPEAPVTNANIPFAGNRMSWLAPIHPFQALSVVTGQTPAPPLSHVAHYGPISARLLAYPQYGYIILTALASVAMILFSLFFVRRGAKEGELTWWTRLTGAVTRSDPTGERRQKPRRVWKNPIAWREASTRASAAGRSAMRWVFIGGGILAGIILLIAHEKGWGALDPAKPDLTRTWLMTFTWIELAVILLVVTNTAATTLTREKETLTIELLLTTPLTSKYIIAGMLRGLVSFVIPMISVPTVTLLLFVLADFFRPGSKDVTTVEAFVMVPLMMTAFTAIAAMVGLQFSLLSKKTVQAVMISTAIVLGGSGLLLGCALAILRGGYMFAAVVLPFTPFHAIGSLIDYSLVFRWEANAPGAGALLTARVVRLITSMIAIVVYAAITYSLYNNMVRNFDMTVRRQSA